MNNLIIKLFNLEPLDIESISCTTTDYTTYAFITLRRTLQCCPSCGTSTRKVHDYRKRTLSHGVINDAFTTIVYNSRRYKCPWCGKVFSEANPFTAPSRRLSKYMVLRIMKMLKNPKVTFSQVAEELGISSSTAIRVFDQHAGITPIQMPECLCIDEVYTVKYKQKVYACILVDMLTSQIYDLRPSRRKYELAEYFSSISRNERLKVKYVCMDMWDTYRSLSRTYFPNAKICVDSFHVIQLINRAFTNVRVNVMKQYSTNSEEYRLLKKYHWILSKDSSKLDMEKYVDLHYYYHLVDSKYVQTRTLLERITDIDVQLEIAYSIKEEYAYINRTSTPENIERRLTAFIDELPTYGIGELDRLARTLQNWKKEIINSFDTYAGRRISNGPIESVNSRIKLIKRNGNGYRNFERFRKRTLYSLNKNSTIKI